MHVLVYLSCGFLFLLVDNVSKRFLTEGFIKSLTISKFNVDDVEQNSTEIKWKKSMKNREKTVKLKDKGILAKSIRF